MANILGRITLDELSLLEVDANPASGAGTVAPVGSLASINTGAGFFLKTGAGNTAWTQFSLAGSLVVTTLTANTLFQTNSNTDVLITGFSLTPTSAGTYMAFANMAVNNSAANGQILMSYYLNSVIVVNSTRGVRSSSSGAIFPGVLLSTGLVFNGTTDTLDVRIQTSKGTVDVNNRNLTLLRYA